MNKVFIIAEAGVNHNGSIELAKKLIDVLLTNKVISKLRRTNNCNGNESSCYEVLVPSTELETAQDLIFENELF